MHALGLHRPRRKFKTLAERERVAAFCNPAPALDKASGLTGGLQIAGQ
jgi:hypothetical protein